METEKEQVRNSVKTKRFLSTFYELLVNKEYKRLFLFSSPFVLSESIAQEVHGTSRQFGKCRRT